MIPTYDLSDNSVVVVIGSGAGGGTLSNELAQKGIDVVCLEAGSRLALADIENDPPMMNERMGWNDKRIGTGVFLCKTVGGTTMRWSGITPRIQPHEFRARSTYGQIADTTLIDWPLTYEEMDPYYDKAELRMGVTGTHDMPPSLETSNYKVLRAGGHKIGYKEITSGRTAINSIPYDGRPACLQIGFCHSGCRIGAKWSTLYTEVPKAEQTGHFELRTGMMAVKINHDDTGKVSGVVYRDSDGILHEQKARAIAVAGNVVETSRLLLNSASQKFPDGLANSSGHLGRNYMRHVTTAVMAIMPGKVNPVIAESVAMVSAQVIGNDATIAIAGQSGNFELNVMMPIAAHNLLESIDLLATSAQNLARQCVNGLIATDKGPDVVMQGLAICTALAPLIGYDAAAGIAHDASESGETIKQVALRETELTEEQLDEILEPLSMTEPSA